jgi:small subunit ribosomal protein S2
LTTLPDLRKNRPEDFAKFRRHSAFSACQTARPSLSRASLRIAVPEQPGNSKGQRDGGFPIESPDLNQGGTRIMINELLSEMVDAGVHFGHQTKKWNPGMKPYLMKDKGGIYIINLEETVRCLDKAADFLSGLAAKEKKILFVGCKRQAQEAVQQAAEATKQFYVNHRWLGGMLTNMSTVKKSIERLKWLENLERSPEFKLISKKEFAALTREKNKLLRNLEGIRNMDGLPDAMVIVDSARETIAVAEARRLNIPIVAIVDSNADPALIDYPIPGNDDSVRSVRVILQNLVDAVAGAAK